MTDPTPEQREAVIEAVTEHWGSLGDAWDNILTEADRNLAIALFLAGVRWAEEQKKR